MKKILINVSYYTPHISGLTNSIKNLVTLLSQNGYQVSILTTQHDKKLAQHETAEVISITRVPYLFKLYKGFFMPTFFFEAASLIQTNEHIIIVLPQLEGFVVAILAKLLKKKVTSLYICEVTLSSNILTKCFEWILKFTHWLTLRLSDNIVTLTHDYAKHTMLLSQVMQKVHTIFPVIVKPYFSLQTETAFRKKLPQKKFVIGFIGRMSSEKGIEYLLNTIPLLKNKWQNNFIIVLAGSLGVGETRYAEKITSLIHSSQDAIVWLQKLDDRELGAFYKSLDVLVLPSINTTEAFGMVQVEAMLLGTPVIASNLPGVRVPIQKTEMGELVPVKNSSALAQAIVHIVANKEKYIKASGVISEYFDEQKILQQWHKLLI